MPEIIPPMLRTAILFSSAAALSLWVDGNGTTARDDLSAQDSQAAGQTWTLVDVPDVWKETPRGQVNRDEGYVWYRCLVKVPATWKGRNLELFLEAVDDAREAYFNGVRIGGAGTFPPQYRSGLGQSGRHTIADETVGYGELNVVAIRTYHNQGRTGFNVAAPVLFGGGQAIRLDGRWQARFGEEGDNVVDVTRQTDFEASDNVVFSKLKNADDVARTLKKLSDDNGPLSPTESLEKFQLPDDLTIELVLSEPEVCQPLSMKFDERGRLWVVQYLQYPEPAGLKMVSRDKFLRTVYDRVPLPPPHHPRGRDKITIHEDTNGDGSFDKHKTFVDGLSLASSIALGRGGVWVLNPPYLLFYPDRNHDDVPDGDPEVHLEGFGIEDSHSVANSLRWGPDGWLYAAQGSTVTGNIKRPGLDTKPVHSLGQLIWRYQPESRRYEIFAEGGGNAFGVEIDSKGRIYSGHNGGDTRGFHYVQGGYYQKGFGKHGPLSNPYALGYFPPMAHAKVPRFTHTFVIYEGGALPGHYAGKLFGVAPLQSHIVQSQIWPDRSSMQTRDEGHLLTSSDGWFRPVDIQAGPDGAIYVADFYEQRIDHASHYQGRVDRTTGRIYRLKPKGAQPPVAIDLAQLSSSQLVGLLSHPNKWFRQAALRLIADRRDGSLVATLRSKIQQTTGQSALEMLWALHLAGGLSDADALLLFGHADPHVRLWTARLLCDEREVSREVAERLADLASREADIEVRCQLACSARRLPAGQSLPIVLNLLPHSEDAADIHIPLLLWWAIEAKAETDRDAVLKLFETLATWDLPMVQQHMIERLMRRYAMAGSRRDLLACAKLLQLAPRPDHVRRLMNGFEQAYQGRPLTGLPEELIAALAQAGGVSLALRLRQGDPAAIKQALEIIDDEHADGNERLTYIQIFGQLKQPECVPLLIGVVRLSDDNSVRCAALDSLQSYDDSQIGREVVRLHNALPDDVRSVAQTLLASRRTWAAELLAAIDAGKLSPQSISLPLVRKILFHDDPQIAALVRKHWGDVQGATTDQMRDEIERLARVVSSAAGNPYEGRQLFRTHCGKCHRLFEEGGEIGPDLTAYRRDDLHVMLLHVVNPSAEIRESFENFVVRIDDGRTASGFVADQDNRVVILRGTDGQSLIIPRERIEDMRAIPQSLMPEGILQTLSDQSTRDLFAYLRSTQPLP